MIKTKTVVLLCIAVFLSKFAVYDITSASFIACGTIISDVVVDPQNPEIVYAISVRDSVFKSIDAGGAWNAVGEEGFFNKPSYSLAVDPENTQIIYAGQYKSIDSGKTWKLISDGQDMTAAISKLTVHPRDTEILYSLTSNKGAYKSTNGGVFWTAIGDEKLGDIRALALDPNDPNILYGYFMREDEYGPGRTTFYDSFGPWEYGMKGEIFKSVDSGVTWTSSLLSVTGIAGLAVDPGNSAIIYAGTRPPNPASRFAIRNMNTGQGIYRSIDGGKQWDFIKFDLPEESAVSVFAFDPKNLRIVYAGTTQGVFISTDYGENWRSINNGFPKNISVRTLAINPRNPDVIYAGTLRDGIYKTIDGGKTWNQANNGIPALPSCP